MNNTTNYNNTYSYTSTLTNTFYLLYKDNKTPSHIYFPSTPFPKKKKVREPEEWL